MLRVYTRNNSMVSTCFRSVRLFRTFAALSPIVLTFFLSAGLTEFLSSRKSNRVLWLSEELARYIDVLRFQCEASRNALTSIALGKQNTARTTEETIGPSIHA